MAARSSSPDRRTATCRARLPRSARTATTRRDPHRNRRRVHGGDRRRFAWRDVQPGRMGRDLLGGAASAAAPLEIEAPIIDAINGPVSVHSEYVLLADITIASEDATFADKPHGAFGIVPGNGIHVIYEEAARRQPRPVLRAHRTGAQRAGSAGARALNEVVPKSEIYDCALEIAEQLATKPRLFLRYTTLALRQRLLQRLNDGTQLGMALEGLTAADLGYQPRPARAERAPLA